MFEQRILINCKWKKRIEIRIRRHDETINEKYSNDEHKIGFNRVSYNGCS